MNLKFSVTQLTEDGSGPESRERILPLGEALFQEMKCFFHVLPRFDVLNEILGRGEIVNGKNQLFRWSVFEFSHPEYEDLKQEVLSHPEWETDVDETFSGTISEWSHWALVRAISK